MTHISYVIDRTLLFVQVFVHRSMLLYSPIQCIFIHIIIMEAFIFESMSRGDGIYSYPSPCGLFSHKTRCQHISRVIFFLVSVRSSRILDHVNLLLSRILSIVMLFRACEITCKPVTRCEKLRRMDSRIAPNMFCLEEVERESEKLVSEEGKSSSHSKYLINMFLRTQKT